MTTDNPLLRGGDELDQWIDQAKRELRTQYMRHVRVIRTWEPAPCPPPPEYPPEIIYADQVRCRVEGEPWRNWLRT